jgi:hypothetical protein
VLVDSPQPGKVLDTFSAGAGASTQTLENKEALVLPQELPDQRFGQAIRLGGFSACAEQAVFTGVVLKNHLKRYNSSENFNDNLVSVL